VTNFYGASDRGLSKCSKIYPERIFMRMRPVHVYNYYAMYIAMCKLCFLLTLLCFLCGFGVAWGLFSNSNSKSPYL